MELEKNLSKTIDFGKIAFYGGRRINSVTVELNLYLLANNKIRFTASGNVWNSKKTDIVCGGQCLDTLYRFLGKNQTFKKIYSWWKEYHLNDSKPGTKAQMEALKEARRQNIEGYNFNDYVSCCDYLKSINLYEDNGYKYGHGWIYEEIPQDVLDEMITFISIKN